MIDKLDVWAHHANCNRLIRLAEKYLPEQSGEKGEMIRVIEAYRRRPDLLQYIEELEKSIFSLIHTYFGGADH